MRNYFRKFKLLKVLLVANLIFFSIINTFLIVLAQNGIPEYINYHGRLKDSAGNPLTGTYNFTFRLYDSSVGGNLVWGPETHNNVQVNNGYFNVRLGSIVPLNIDFKNPYWLSIEVNNDGEMSPRIPLTSFPYAFTAQKLIKRNGDITIETINTGNIIIKAAGFVGIGTSTPEYDLDVWGRVRSLLGFTALVNFEVLTSDKTLTPGIDNMYQWLSTDGTNKKVYLGTNNAKTGDRFIIKNNDDYTQSTLLEIIAGHTTLDYISPGSIKEYIFIENQGWVSGNPITGIFSRDFNITIGALSKSFNVGIAIGYEATAESGGITIGNYSTSSGQNSLTIGNYAQSYDGGFALGHLSYASGAEALAIGNNSFALNSSVSIGIGLSDNYSIAIGGDSRNEGISIGYYSGWGQSSIPSLVGRNIFIGNNSGEYIGYWGEGGYGNIMIGHNAGVDENNPTENSFMAGSYNILIGTNSWVPASSTSQFLNIGGLIFGNGLSSNYGEFATGSVGIGTIDLLDFAKFAVGNTISNKKPIFGIPVNTLSTGIFSFDPNPDNIPYTVSILGAIPEIPISSNRTVSGVAGLLTSNDANTYYLSGILADLDSFYNIAKGVTGWIENCPIGYSCFSGFFGGRSPDYKFWIDDGGANININTSSPLYFALNVTSNYTDSIFSVRADGNIGIGITTPSQKLHVVGSSSDTTVVRISTQGGNDCDFNTLTGTFSCLSDIRLKKNISKLSNDALSKILKLNPVSYHYNWQKEEDTPLYGFIAQEFETVFPELVFTDKEKGYKSLSYTPLIPYIIKAIQEQQKQIEIISLNNTGFNNTGFNLFEKLNQAGLVLEDGYIKVKKSITENLQIGSIENPSGITIYDEDSKEPYCIKIKNGQMVVVSGECFLKQNYNQNFNPPQSYNNNQQENGANYENQN